MKRQTGFFLLFIAALCWVFRDAMAAIAQSWQQDEYSHGYFIPVIALVLLLNAMEDKQVTAKPSWAGFAVVLICLVFNAFCEMAGIHGILPDVYLVALIGSVAAFWGVKAAVSWRGR
jgi:hypothetical protein